MEMAMARRATPGACAAIIFEPSLVRMVDQALSAGVISGSSYARKLVTAISGGVFDLFDAVLERHSLDEFGQLV